MAETSPGNAAVLERVEALHRWMTELSKDTREARDGVLSIKATLDAYDIPVRIEALRGDMEKGFQGARADLVNAQGHIRQEVRDLEVRIKVLEDGQARDDGAKGFAGWVLRHAPWLFTGIAGILAGIGLKDKLPG